MDIWIWIHPIWRAKILQFSPKLNNIIWGRRWEGVEGDDWWMTMHSLHGDRFGNKCGNINIPGGCEMSGWRFVRGYIRPSKGNFSFVCESEMHDYLIQTLSIFYIIFIFNNENQWKRWKPIYPQGNFAFLCESAMLDYFVQQDCNLTQIGGLLDSKVSSWKLQMILVVWCYLSIRCDNPSSQAVRCLFWIHFGYKSVTQNRR